MVSKHPGHWPELAYGYRQLAMVWTSHAAYAVVVQVFPTGLCQQLAAVMPMLL